MDLMKKDLVMTSLEVAEITGKSHTHVMRDIREEVESLKSEGLEGQTIFGESSYKNSQNKEQPMYTFGREGAMQIATRYSAGIRRKLIMKLEELENKTKLPGNYKEALLALVAAEEEKEQLLLANKQQQELIAHKVEVITGLTDEVDVFKKKDIINRIIKNSGNLYRERYNEIYSAFKNTYHIDLPVRSKSYNAKQTKKKDQLSVIGYAEKFGHIDQMYKVCCKLYETEVNSLLKELGLLVNL